VVDNASDDGTPDVVAREFPWVRLRRRRRNDGFAVANNEALRDVTAPYVLVLNPDTEVPHGVVERLLERLRTEDRIGVIGCRLVQADGTFDHASKRSFPRPADAARYFLPGGRRASRYVAPHVDEHGTGPVDAVNGAFMLVRRDAMDEVGLLDEDFWMYGEDLDWCRRFAECGWVVEYDGTVTAVHLKGASSGRRRGPRLNWHFHRSMAVFYRKHEAGRQVGLDALVYAGIGAHLAASIVAGALPRWRS
jgi:GT2 family glycosyltransferase